ncbi:unnamed protein product [Gongylonema pulchrum]|uniref:NAC domain-containing protein n=1 Tax=Gongylonema pulchrum TaxID=637853 RepID=A0A183EVV7_9BILA|nr:unnamed protein product [Gongylonema pulchrum]
MDKDVVHLRTLVKHFPEEQSIDSPEGSGFEEEEQPQREYGKEEKDEATTTILPPPPYIHTPPQYAHGKSPMYSLLHADYSSSPSLYAASSGQQFIVGELTDSLILPFCEPVAVDAERIPVPALQRAQILKAYYSPPEKYELEDNRDETGSNSGGWRL